MRAFFGWCTVIHGALTRTNNNYRVVGCGEVYPFGSVANGDVGPGSDNETGDPDRIQGRPRYRVRCASRPSCRQPVRFGGALKRELGYHRRFRTRLEVKAAIQQYIEVFYYRMRRRLALGNLAHTIVAENSLFPSDRLTRAARTDLLHQVG